MNARDLTANCIPDAHAGADYVDDEDADAIVHSDRYYLQLLRSLEQDIGTIGKKQHNLKDDDAKSPYLLMLRPGRTYKHTQHTKGVVAAKEKEAREWQRQLFLCAKEAKESSGSNHEPKTTVAMLEGSKASKPSALERLVERTLLDPLRQDPAQLQYLKRKVGHWKAANVHSIPEQRPLSPRAQSPADQALRHAQAKMRREEAQLKDDMPLLVIPAPGLHPTLRSSARRSSARVLRWLQIWAVLKTISTFGKRVHGIRAIRMKNYAMWKSVLTLQRAWRRKRKPKQMSTLEKMKATMNSSHVRTFALRKDAASLITRFLLDTRYPACFRKVIRQTKRIQRLARVFHSITLYRSSLLQMLMEACIPSLSFHISLVCAGKGLDLHNLSSLETSQLKLQQATVRAPMQSKDMSTADFHSFLRANLSKITDFHRDYVSSTKLWHDAASLRKTILTRFLRGKRRQFVIDLEKIDPMVLETRPVSLEEARNFIQNDEDALVDHLEMVNKKVKDYYKQRAKKKTPFRKRRNSIVSMMSFNSGKLEALLAAVNQPTPTFKMPLMLLLSMVSAKEIMGLFWELSEACRIVRSPGRAAAVVSSGAGSHDKSRGHHSGHHHDFAPHLTSVDSHSSIGDHGHAHIHHAAPAHHKPSRRHSVIAKEGHQLASSAHHKPAPPLTQRRSSINKLKTRSESFRRESSFKGIVPDA